MFALADESTSYVLLNVWMGEVPSRTPEDYPEPIYETFLLKSRIALFESLSSNPTNYLELGWSDWRLNAFGGWESFAAETGTERFGVEVLQTSSILYAGAVREFLNRLLFNGSLSGWRLNQSAGPQSYTLTNEPLDRW